MPRGGGRHAEVAPICRSCIRTASKLAARRRHRPFGPLLHACRPGRGYVHPAEAADEILDEALQPFRDDHRRRAGNSETLLEYSPDHAAERASGVASDCARLGIELPTAELLDLMPAWSALLD
jgi:hypothetical protein